mmetsp:Transcript_102242/g.248510  ORF Transcript_102242/g.248510 Transcript_102242/m.248510 type:complete len:272 (+) Transcript_102242:45-860(+)
MSDHVQSAFSKNGMPRGYWHAASVADSLTATFNCSAFACALIKFQAQGLRPEPTKTVTPPKGKDAGLGRDTVASHLALACTVARSLHDSVLRQVRPVVVLLLLLLTNEVHQAAVLQLNSPSGAKATPPNGRGLCHCHGSTPDPSSLSLIVPDGHHTEIKLGWPEVAATGGYLKAPGHLLTCSHLHHPLQQLATPNAQIPVVLSGNGRRAARGLKLSELLGAEISQQFLRRLLAANEPVIHFDAQDALGPWEQLVHEPRSVDHPVCASEVRD